VAEGYQATTRSYLEAFSAAGLKLVGFDESTEVVDIACGPGTTALLLAPKVRRIACVDFSEGMLARLRLNTAAAGLSNIEVHRADGQALPFPDESFDLAVSMFGLMFFPDRTKGFSELCRVLRPGGQALVSSWAPASRSPLMQTVMAALRSDDVPASEPPPSGLEDPFALEREMLAAGMTEVSVTAVTHALEVRNIEAFWRDTVRGTAPIALMKHRMGPQEWNEIERHALDRLRRTLAAKLPASLASTAYLAVGRKR
jgi:SAM-dependent methyltransferase